MAIPASGSDQPAASGTLHLLYHQLCLRPQNYRYTMSVEQFADQLNLFARIRSRPNTLQPAITFDDGYQSDVELALPMLEQHGLKAAFFITAGWTGTRNGYMDRQGIRRLHAAGHTVGAHGWTHTLFTACSAAQLMSELVDARTMLEDILGHPVHALSFPGGRYNRTVIQACRSAGYTSLYTSEPQPTGLPAGDLIGRLNLRADTTTAWLERLFSSNDPLLRSLQRADRIKKAAKICLGDPMYARLWRWINRAENDA